MLAQAAIQMLIIDCAWAGDYKICLGEQRTSVTNLSPHVSMHTVILEQSYRKIYEFLRNTGTRNENNEERKSNPSAKFYYLENELFNKLIELKNGVLEENSGEVLAQIRAIARKIKIYINNLPGLEENFVEQWNRHADFMLGEFDDAEEQAIRQEISHVIGIFFPHMPVQEKKKLFENQKEWITPYSLQTSLKTEHLKKSIVSYQGNIMEDLDKLTRLNAKFRAIRPGLGKELTAAYCAELFFYNKEATGLVTKNAYLSAVVGRALFFMRLKEFGLLKKVVKNKPLYFGLINYGRSVIKTNAVEEWDNAIKIRNYLRTQGVILGLNVLNAASGQLDPGIAGNILVGMTMQAVNDLKEENAIVWKEEVLSRLFLRFFWVGGNIFSANKKLIREVRGEEECITLKSPADAILPQAACVLSIEQAI